MASGCISILPKSGGADEYLIDRVNSFALAYPEDKNEIISVVSRLINEPSYFEKIRNQALLTASNYSIRSSAMSEISLFSTSLKRHSVSLYLSELTIVYLNNFAIDGSIDSPVTRYLPLIKKSNLKCGVKTKYILDPPQYAEKVAKKVVFHGFYENINIEELKKILQRYKESDVQIIYDVIDNHFDFDVLCSRGVTEDKAKRITEQAHFLATNSNLLIAKNDELKFILSEKFSLPIVVESLPITGQTLHLL